MRGKGPIGLTEPLRRLKAAEDFPNETQLMEDTVDEIKNLIVERTAEGFRFFPLFISSRFAEFPLIDPAGA